MANTTFVFDPTPALLSGRTILITGANTGLGLETAIHLARLEPEYLILAVRTPSKGEQARVTISEKSGLAEAKISVRQVDMASFESVKAFAAGVEADLPRLDIAVLNAGIADFSWITTPDGWEQQLQVNGLSTGLLALELLPLLAKTATLPVEGTLKRFTPHLTITGSSVHEWFQYIPAPEGTPFLKEFNDPDSPNGLIAGEAGPIRYNFTKLVSNQLAHQLSALKLAQGVIVDVVNPGLCESELVRTAPEQLKNYLRTMSLSAVEGSKNIAWGAIADLMDTPGAYIDEMKVAPPSEWSMSAEGLEFERKFFEEMSELWVELDPKLRGNLI